MEYFKSEKTKIGAKTYLILAICLFVYFLVGGYYMYFPGNDSIVNFGIGIVVAIPFLLYFLKTNNNK